MGRLTPVLPAPDDLEGRLERCGRLLERQRRAREDAEAIAEEGLRALYLRQQRSELLQRVATIANHTSSARQAYTRALDEICAHSGCVLGNVLLRGRKTGALEPSGIHQLADPALLDFIAQSDGACLTSVAGLPGRVLGSKQACWIENLAEDGAFVRVAVARACGLVSAFAFPVLVGSEVNAILEFYSASPLPRDPELLETLAQVGVQLGRVVEREALTCKLTHDAHHDALTGLPNKVQFRDRLHQALARAGGAGAERVAVMFMDLDGFKLVNDSAGHHSGDQLLIDVAQSLGRTLDEITDCGSGGAGRCLDFMLARFGGDEFTILLDGPQARAAALDIARALLVVLERNRLQVNGVTYSVSSAIGIAYPDGAATSCDDLMRNADLAMYDAKRRGRGHIRVFGSTLHRAAQERFSVGAALTQALAQDEFVLHYQPIIALADRRLVGFEALLRWRRDDGVLLPPTTFIDLAEELDLIGGIGRFVLVEACRQARAWAAHGPAYVSVNVSPKQFRQDAFLQDVENALSRSGLPASGLRLEVTESIAIKDPERARAMLHALREMGVRVSLDDFGTGYSALSHLHRFPFDTLKIDRSFVSGMAGSARNRGIVKAVLDLAATLELEVVAEGVELEAEAELLRDLDCSHAQGHLFGWPVSADEAIAQLRRATLGPPLGHCA